MLYPPQGFVRRSGKQPGVEHDDTNYRPDFHRDYARILHSSAFRRLNGKTQLFPTDENDFFRNRLTHSLEVAQVAASVARKINREHAYFSENLISERLCELAALAHDIGHPPFGHNGEEALNELLNGAGGFEGNAQTLRIVSRLEKKEFVGEASDQFTRGEGHDFADNRVGLDLCARSMAAMLKYDSVIPQAKRQDPKVHKGYYYDDRGVVDFIKQHVGMPERGVPFKTIECSIMDISDDISYSTYDLEDSFKAGFLSPIKMLAVDTLFKSDVSDEVRRRAKIYYPERESDWKSFAAGDVDEILRDIFEDVLTPDAEHIRFVEREEGLSTADVALLSASVYRASKLRSQDGYFRTAVTSNLVSRFVNGVEVLECGGNPIFWTARLRFEDFLCVEVLKRFAFKSLIMSSFLRISEARGGEIISAIFKAIEKGDGGAHMLPADYRELCDVVGDNHIRSRILCDFVSSMTDRYALEFYSRLFSTSPPSIFKPY